MSIQTKKQRVIVGMSGGVDSSVTALLLKQQGYTVEGLFMKNWEEDDGTEYCTAKEDLADAQQVCDKLNIPLHAANFAAEYWDNVFEHFLTEYKAGRTPNPDILCNREIKFKAFLEYACEVLGADLIATGHYARVRHISGTQAELLKGLDNNKDQSYFLHAVQGTEFAKTLFPVGEMEKTEVRKIAAEHDLITHNKKDSTGICFIGERKFRDFLKQYVPAQRGNIVTVEGDTIGQHEGVMFHTIGQRQGLKIGGLKLYSEEPWYVVDKDVTNNQVIVAQGSNHPKLYAKKLFCQSVSWINEMPTLPLKCSAKNRYRQSDQSCTVTQTADDRIEVVFDSPQRAITPGQYVVIYKDDVCLGGGIIDSYQ